MKNINTKKNTLNKIKFQYPKDIQFQRNSDSLSSDKFKKNTNKKY